MSFFDVFFSQNSGTIVKIYNCHPFFKKYEFGSEYKIIQKADFQALFYDTLECFVLIGT